LADLIKEGIRHKVFALIKILQPCVSFNRVNTFKLSLVGGNLCVAFLLANFGI
jgi:pyruvate/2-oxoacid:ferredoxin oxidoreductase beta subunit